MLDSTPLPTFRKLFCELEKCADDRFEKVVFWKALRRRTLPVAWILHLLNPVRFSLDFDIIRQVGSATSYYEVEAISNSLRFDYGGDNKFFRRVLGVRLSGRRILRLANTVFAASKPRRLV
jgi:hypothetical protein